MNVNCTRATDYDKLRQISHGPLLSTAPRQWQFRSRAARLVALAVDFPAKNSREKSRCEASLRHSGNPKAAWSIPSCTPSAVPRSPRALFLPQSTPQGFSGLVLIGSVRVTRHVRGLAQDWQTQSPPTFEWFGAQRGFCASAPLGSCTSSATAAYGCAPCVSAASASSTRYGARTARGASGSSTSSAPFVIATGGPSRIAAASGAAAA